MTSDTSGSKSKGVIAKMKRRFTIGSSKDSGPPTNAAISSTIVQKLPGATSIGEDLDLSNSKSSSVAPDASSMAQRSSLLHHSQSQVLQVTNSLVTRPEKRGEYGRSSRSRQRGMSTGAHEKISPSSSHYKTDAPQRIGETGEFVKGAMAISGFGKMDSYHKLEKLGEGTYACVFKGISAVTGCWVALKEITIERDEGAPCTAIREISLLRQLKHENIVTLHDVALTSKILTLVFEFVPRDLKKVVDDANGILPLPDVKNYLRQLLSGLEFFHKRNILHRDLKPQNLLIHADDTLKIADFGLARATGVPIKTFSNEVVTLWYRPPDVLMGSVSYTTTIDMWSAGCIFAEMISGLPLFPGSNGQDELVRIFEIFGNPTEASWPGVSEFPDYKPDVLAHKTRTLETILPRMEPMALNLLKEMLVYAPEQRISAKDALDDVYFDA